MLGIFAIGIAFVIITGGIDLSIGSVVGLTGVIIARLSSTQTGGLGYPLVDRRLGGAGRGRGRWRLARAADHAAEAAAVHRHARRHAAATRRFADDRRRWRDQHGRLAFVEPGQRRLIARRARPADRLAAGDLRVVAALGAYVLHYTVLGRYIYAIGGNRDAARYSGINVNRVELLTYVISAGTACIAGICYAAYIGQMSQQVGVAYELYAIAAPCSAVARCAAAKAPSSVF